MQLTSFLSLFFFFTSLLKADTTKLNMTETSNVVYVGIPLTKDGILADETAVSASSVEKSSGWGGFVAFLFAAFLASLGWVANQGWTILSVLAFGE